jgi:2-succinyl-5-enolpyruvyl-6-hydroxy-3-cyclohexene-1-carboxylate synthase
MTGPEPSNINHIWADLLVEELLRAGVGLFCLAPGSRSTPLVRAVAANSRAAHLMHFDERGTAFSALGFGRATRRPAAWITTSGTAVANGMPAVVEASADAVPMLLLTADRPPELRATGANQTIDQVKLFGDYVRWQFDMPAPDARIDPAFVLTTADQAVHRACRAPAGPVHLNVMYREPLAPEPDGGTYDRYLDALPEWAAGHWPYTRYAASHSRCTGTGVLWRRLREARRGLIVAGRLDTRAQGDAVRWLSDRLGWPILPDVCSQLRLGGDSMPDYPAYYYDLVLSSASFREINRPDAVLYFGARSTSKRLNRFIAEARPRDFVVIREAPERTDPHHRVTGYVEADIVGFCAELIDLVETGPAAASEWTHRWTAASETAGRLLDDQLGEVLSEPVAARLLTARAPEGSGLMLASSMPVRDTDTYGAEAQGAPFVAANRGASGIDGTVATAAGLARGLQREVTLLLGDLALLHDLNSLALLAASPEPVIVVVINNHGGGIFSFLPIARHREVFESFFGTPHAFSFEHAARMFDLDYASPASLDDFARIYEEALSERSSCIIEVTTDRAENVELHRRVEAAVAEAVSP